MDELSPAEALRLSARRPETFTAFYRCFAERLTVRLARQVADADLAMDLVAETFAQAYRARRRFRGSLDAEAAAWLYRIADRQVAQFARKAKAERKALRRLAVEPPALDDLDRERIDELAGLSELRASLSSELALLSRAEREALELRVVEELPYSEVARRLRISEPAARQRVVRALRRLAMTITPPTPEGASQ